MGGAAPAGLKVFITGASSGLGEALAVEYAAAGATLGLAGRRGEALNALRDRLVAAGADAAAIASYAVDVTDAPAVASAARDFIERHGAPDVVVACAGIAATVDIAQAASLDALRGLMDTNVLGTLATFQPFVAPMQARGRGKLVGIASVAGVRGMPGAAGYGASKAAVIAFCEALRIELRGTGVEVLTILPGYVRTPMTAGVPYRQPFLMAPTAFARHAVAAIAAGTRYAVIPWQMAWVARWLKLLPGGVYDALMKRARRPRAVGT